MPCRLRGRDAAVTKVFCEAMTMLDVDDSWILHCCLGIGSEPLTLSRRRFDSIRRGVFLSSMIFLVENSLLFCTVLFLRVIFSSSWINHPVPWLIDSLNSLSKKKCKDRWLNDSFIHSIFFLRDENCEETGERSCHYNHYRKTNFRSTVEESSCTILVRKEEKERGDLCLARIRFPNNDIILRTPQAGRQWQAGRQITYRHTVVGGLKWNKWKRKQKWKQNKWKQKVYH